MISVSRTPYRISLLGGGSDLDWFLAEQGYGMTLGFAIADYSYAITAFSPLNTKGILNYSSREEYIHPENISHPLIRSAIQRLSINHFIELSSFGSFQHGSGLGGSSSFLISILSSLSNLYSQEMAPLDIAKLACEIEIDLLGSPIGRQDQYLSALGGINCLKFSHPGTVDIMPLRQSEVHLTKYISSLLLVDTGISRQTYSVLNAVKEDHSSIEALLIIRSIIFDFYQNAIITPLPYSEFETRLTRAIQSSWAVKKSMKAIMNSRLSEIENTLSSVGLVVLKLLGAGAGGFFLATLPNHLTLQEINETLQLYGLNVRSVSLSPAGVSTWSL